MLTIATAGIRMRAEWSQGKYKAPLFTAKGRLQPYVLQRHPQMTAVFPSFAIFYTNWIEYYHPKCATPSCWAS